MPEHDPAGRFVPVRSQPTEALRLLEDYQREYPAGDEARVAGAFAQVREELRGGRAEGLLWWGPHDEAVGLALWRAVERLGCRVSDLYLAPGFRSTASLGRLVDGIERSNLDLGPVIALPGVIPGLSDEEQRAAFAPRGMRTQSRLAMRRRTDAPLERRPTIPPGRPLRPVEESDEPWISRLYQESFEGSVDRFWMDHGDLQEDARRLWKDLLGGRWGPWLPFASFAHDRPGGLEGASLVCHPPGRCPLLLELMVEPARQHHGLGRALLSKTLVALQAARLEELELNVVRENAPAFELYTKMGFAPVPGTELTFWVKPGAIPTARATS